MSQLDFYIYLKPGYQKMTSLFYLPSTAKPPALSTSLGHHYGDGIGILYRNNIKLKYNKDLSYYS